MRFRSYPRIGSNADKIGGPWVATEKLQIGSLLIDASSFECLTEQVLGRAAVLFPSEVPGNRFSYAEAWTGLAFSWFAEQNVDDVVQAPNHHLLKSRKLRAFHASIFFVDVFIAVLVAADCTAFHRTLLLD